MTEPFPSRELDLQLDTKSGLAVVVVKSVQAQQALVDALTEASRYAEAVAVDGSLSDEVEELTQLAIAATHLALRLVDRSNALHGPQLDPNVTLH